MADIKKVIKGLKTCTGSPHNCVGKRCPYFDTDECRIVMEKDALELLKKQDEEIKTLSAFAKADGIDVDVLLRRKVL